jgi:hypothetical protein
MSVNAEALTDYVMLRTRPLLSSGASHLPRLVSCEYCGRGAYLSDGLTCKGCGGPLPIDDSPPTYLVHEGLYDRAFVRALGIPGANIPIRVPPPTRSRLADFIDGVASAAAVMF